MRDPGENPRMINKAVDVGFKHGMEPMMESAAAARVVKADHSSGLLFIAIIGNMGLAMRGEAVASGRTKGSSSDSMFLLSSYSQSSP